MAEYTKIPISLYVLLMYVNKKGLIDNYFRRRQQILVRSDNQIWTPQLYLYIFLLYVYVFITYKRLKVINKTQPWISSPIQNRVFFYYYFFLMYREKTYSAVNYFLWISTSAPLVLNNTRFLHSLERKDWSDQRQQIFKTCG